MTEPAVELHQHQDQDQDQDQLSEADILACDFLYKIERVAIDMAIANERIRSDDEGILSRKEDFADACRKVFEACDSGDCFAALDSLFSLAKALAELKCRVSFLNGKSLSKFELECARQAGMRAGRRSSLTAARKSAAVRLYAERRDSTASPHDAAKQLQDEIVRMAQEMGKPLSVDRAFDTIYEWFREHDKKYPRNH